MTNSAESLQTVDTQATVASLLVGRTDDDQVGVLFEDDDYAWSEVVALSAARASLLAELLDASRPPHVGVLLENVPEYLWWLGGAALAGATIVGGNPTRRGAELARDLAHTDCQFVVVDSAYRDLLPHDLDLPVVDLDSPEYATALARHQGALVPGQLPDQDARFLLMFTSGSTSAPKAVSASTGRVAMAGQRVAVGYGVYRTDVCYLQMPLFHGNALLACWAGALAVGATIVLRRRFSASGFIEDVRRYGCTYFTYVGRTISYVLSQPPRSFDRDHSLRWGFGTEASAADRDRFEARFGCRLVEGYGSSESAIVIKRTPETRAGALGLPDTRDMNNIAVASPETGHECERAEFDNTGRLTNPTEAIGELVNKAGGGGFTGYYNNPEATAARLRDGWYWSGDLAFRDADGFFWFAGRTDDWIRVDSENLGAEPIAAVLARWEAVAAAAVYGVPDPVTGDQVMVAFEMVDGVEFDAAAFAHFLAAQADLGKKWAPTFVRIVEAMPVTANNKLNKQDLRRDAFMCTDPVWWTPGRDLHYRRLTAEERASIEAEFAINGRSALLQSL